jgi:hypothetical protein
MRLDRLVPLVVSFVRKVRARRMNGIVKTVCESALTAGAAGAVEQDPDTAVTAGAVYAAVMLIVKGIIALVKIYRARKESNRG